MSCQVIFDVDRQRDLPLVSLPKPTLLQFESRDQRAVGKKSYVPNKSKKME